MAESAGARQRRTAQGERPRTNRTKWTTAAPAGAVLIGASTAAVLFVDQHALLFATGAGAASIGWWLATRAPHGGRGEPSPSTLLSLDGEAMTADQLDALVPLGWRSMHHLALEHGHIDHVAVGPGGVFAVETAMSTALWTLNVPGTRLLEAAAQTKRSAAKTRSILRSQGIAVDVLPLLVLWGDMVGTAELVDGVAVVHGDAVHRWFEERSVGTFHDAAKVEDALTSFVSSRQ